jgi:hypothetical protein
MAYPYLPGSGTEAFKGVSVVLGVMISLGSTTTVSYSAASCSTRGSSVGISSDRRRGVGPPTRRDSSPRGSTPWNDEYELNAHIERPEERIAVLTALHANVQDAFNEHGVRIMSPHDLGDPASAKVVPPPQWYPGPARRKAE